MPRPTAAIGFDLGGSHFTAAGVAEDGTLVTEITRVDVNPNWQQKQILAAMAGVILTLKANLNREGFEVIGSGGGVPGPADYNSGIIGPTPNMVTLRGCHLAEELDLATGLSIKINNDANLMVLGESRFGAGKGQAIVYGNTIGTGFGHGLVIDGKIYTGSNFLAMELAKAPIAFGGEYTNIEDAVSTAGIIRHYHQVAGIEISPRLIEKRAQENEKAAIETYRWLGLHLGFTLAWIQATVAPDVMLIGGNVAKAWDLFSPAMMGFLIQHSWNKDPVVKPMALGETAGIIGGATLFFE